MKYQLEVIGFNIEGFIKSQSAGAHRIELCASPGEGGTTPSYAIIKVAREKLLIPLYVMIRPRGGDFLYSDDDFEIMKNEVLMCKELNCDGVVFGILTEDGKVDKERCKILMEMAYPMQATFHRAFDRVANPFESLEDIIELGFERILTSGLVPQAYNGKNTLAALVKLAAGRIIIMPGSGVKSSNIIDIAESTGATELHSSASIPAESKMNYVNPMMSEKLSTVTVNEEEVKKMVELLKKYEDSNREK